MARIQMKIVPPGREFSTHDIKMSSLEDWCTFHTHPGGQEVGEGWAVAGHNSFNNPVTMQDEKGIVCLKLQDGVVKAGTGWMKIWSYRKNDMNTGRGSIWVPTCDDPDYVPIGIFYNQGFSERYKNKLIVIGQDRPELNDPKNEMNPNILLAGSFGTMPAAAMVHHSFTKPMAIGDMYEAWRLAENVQETGELTLCEQHIGNGRLLCVRPSNGKHERSLVLDESKVDGCFGVVNLACTGRSYYDLTYYLGGT